MVKSGTNNSSPGQGTKPAFKQCNIKEKHMINDEIAHKPDYENVWHMIMIKQS